MADAGNPPRWSAPSRPGPRRAESSRRLFGVYAGFLALLGLLWLRCVWLQVIQSPELSRRANAQHWMLRAVPAPRGTVYDREGRILAMSVRVPSVFGNPRQVKAKAKARLASEMSLLLKQPQPLLARRLARQKGFVWLARHVDPELLPRLATLRSEGIGVVEEEQRVYPHGRFASHLLGHVDIDQQGLEGLELELDEELQGRAGTFATLRDAKGDALIGPWTVQRDPTPGSSVVLTVDSVVQGIAEDALSFGVEKFHAKGGSLIVMDPATGAILAMATRPTFDPQAPGRAKTEARRNRAITDLAEPGSVFKVVTASALLEEHRVRPEEQFFCENGAYPTIGHHVLHDHRPHGWLSFHDVIALSSNIGTAKAASRLKPEELYRYIRAFGFGRKTGIELPGEVSGIVPPPARWSRLSPFIIPIGQEVAVTPIQLAGMMSVIANGGSKVHPYLIERIEAPAGRVVRAHRAAPAERVLNPDTVTALHSMLSSVVDTGTGQLAKIPGLTVAGKTGTAQKLEPNGRYSHSRFVASFVGYGPVPDPSVPASAGAKFVVVVTIDEPHPLYFGGVVAAPVFRRVVESLASYWGLTVLAKVP